MEHFYNKIDGFFNYPDVFVRAIKSIPNNSHIVEIGAYKGCSTAHLAVEVINSGKNIKMDVIDSWNGEDGTTRPAWADYPKCTGDIFEEFKTNLAPVWHIINPIQSFSHIAADLYADNSLDFVFVDACHYYEGVKKDLIKWLPKMKIGSIIAGHDYNPISWPGVVRAVNESFTKDQIQLMGECWFIQL